MMRWDVDVWMCYAAVCRCVLSYPCNCSDEFSDVHTNIFLTYTRRKPNESAFFALLARQCVWRHMAARDVFAHQTWLDRTHHDAIDERVWFYHIKKTRLAQTRHAQGASARLCSYLEQQEEQQHDELKQRIAARKLKLAQQQQSSVNTNGT